MRRERLSEFYLAQFKAERGNKRGAEKISRRHLRRRKPAENRVARPGADRTESREGTQKKNVLVAEL
jgi:hypothetical protein